jgi:hypothetical protein
MRLSGTTEPTHTRDLKTGLTTEIIPDNEHLHLATRDSAEKWPSPSLAAPVDRAVETCRGADSAHCVTGEKGKRRLALRQRVSNPWLVVANNRAAEEAHRV